MDDVVAMCAGLPTRTFEPGETLLSEGADGGAVFVLATGAVEIRKAGITVTRVIEPGSFLGEMSALLEMPNSADVIALERATVLVLEDPADSIAASPELALAVARLLARRLHAVTSYLTDLKRQYAGTDGHLAMMDQVLGELVSLRPRSLDGGSERGDVPDQ